MSSPPTPPPESPFAVPALDLTPEESYIEFYSGRSSSADEGEIQHQTGTNSKGKPAHPQIPPTSSLTQSPPFFSALSAIQTPPRSKASPQPVFSLTPVSPGFRTFAPHPGQAQTSSESVTIHHQNFNFHSDHFQKESRAENASNSNRMGRGNKPNKDNKGGGSRGGKGTNNQWGGDWSASWDEGSWNESYTRSYDQPHTENAGADNGRTSAGSASGAQAQGSDPSRPLIEKNSPAKPDYESTSIQDMVAQSKKEPNGSKMGSWMENWTPAWNKKDSSSSQDSNAKHSPSVGAATGGANFSTKYDGTGNYEGGDDYSYPYMNYGIYKLSSADNSSLPVSREPIDVDNLVQEVCSEKSILQKASTAYRLMSKAMVWALILDLYFVFVLLDTALISGAKCEGDWKLCLWLILGIFGLPLSFFVDRVANRFSFR